MQQAGQPFQEWLDLATLARALQPEMSPVASAAAAALLVSKVWSFQPTPGAADLATLHQVLDLLASFGTKPPLPWANSTGKLLLAAAAAALPVTPTGATPAPASHQPPLVPVMFIDFPHLATALAALSLPKSSLDSRLLSRILDHAMTTLLDQQDSQVSANQLETSTARYLAPLMDLLAACRRLEVVPLSATTQRFLNTLIRPLPGSTVPLVLREPAWRSLLLRSIATLSLRPGAQFWATLLQPPSYRLLGPAPLPRPDWQDSSTLSSSPPSVSINSATPAITLPVTGVSALTPEGRPPSDYLAVAPWAC